MQVKKEQVLKKYIFAQKFQSIFYKHLFVFIWFRDRDCDKENAACFENEDRQDVGSVAAVEKIVASGKAKKRKTVKHADEKVNKKKPRIDPEVNLEDDHEPNVNLLDNSAPIISASILMFSVGL